MGTKVLVYSVLQRSHVYYELAYGIACTEYCIYLDIERFESQGNECQQIYKIIDMEMHS